MYDHNLLAGRYNINSSPDSVSATHSNLPQLIAKAFDVWHSNLKRTKLLNQRRNTHKTSSHIQWQLRKFIVNYLSKRRNRPIFHIRIISGLRYLHTHVFDYQR